MAYQVTLQIKCMKLSEVDKKVLIQLCNKDNYNVKLKGGPLNILWMWRKIWRTVSFLEDRSDRFSFFAEGH